MTTARMMVWKKRLIAMTMGGSTLSLFGVGTCSPLQPLEDLSNAIDSVTGLVSDITSSSLDGSSKDPAYFGAADAAMPAGVRGGRGNDNYRETIPGPELRPSVELNNKYPENMLGP